MFIIITCRCGKKYSVGEEFAGKNIQCPACNEVITAPGTPHIGSAGTIRPEAASVPYGNNGSSGADIPEDPVSCPPATAQKYIEFISTSLDEHLNDPGSVAADEQMKKGLFSVSTYIFAAFFFASIAMIIAGIFSNRGTAEALGVIGFMSTSGFGIALLVTFTRDYKASHIQDTGSPEKAFRRYISAVHSGRTRKAFCSLAPAAREVGAVETIGFKKFASTYGEYSISDVPSFKKYWLGIFKGPSGQQRTVTLKKVAYVKKIREDMAIIKADFYCTAYPSWMALLMLVGLCLAALVMTIVQYTNGETKTVTKLIVKRNGRWYIADGEFEGVFDKAAQSLS